MPHSIVVKWLCILAFEMNLFFKTQNVFRETQNFLLVYFLTVTELGHIVYFLTVTELGHSEIVSLKSMFPMSNSGCFNFYM